MNLLCTGLFIVLTFHHSSGRIPVKPSQHYINKWKKFDFYEDENVVTQRKKTAYPPKAHNWSLDCLTDVYYKLQCHVCACAADNVTDTRGSCRRAECPMENIIPYRVFDNAEGIQPCKSSDQYLLCEECYCSTVTNIPDKCIHIICPTIGYIDFSKIKLITPQVQPPTTTLSTYVTKERRLAPKTTNKEEIWPIETGMSSKQTRFLITSYPSTSIIDLTTEKSDTETMKTKFVEKKAELASIVPELITKSTTGINKSILKETDNLAIRKQLTNKQRIEMIKTTTEKKEIIATAHATNVEKTSTTIGATSKNTDPVTTIRKTTEPTTTTRTTTTTTTTRIATTSTVVTALVRTLTTKSAKTEMIVFPTTYRRTSTTSTTSKSTPIPIAQKMMQQLKHSIRFEIDAGSHSSRVNINGMSFVNGCDRFSSKTHNTTLPPMCSKCSCSNEGQPADCKHIACEVTTFNTDKAVYITKSRRPICKPRQTYIKCELCWCVALSTYCRHIKCPEKQDVSREKPPFRGRRYFLSQRTNPNTHP